MQTAKIYIANGSDYPHFSISESRPGVWNWVNKMRPVAPLVSQECYLSILDALAAVKSVAPCFGADAILITRGQADLIGLQSL